MLIDLGKKEGEKFFMGRYPYSNRMTVEESKSLSTKFLKKHNYFCGLNSGVVTWSRSGNKTGSISIKVDVLNKENAFIQFQYTQTDRTTDKKSEIDYKAKLVSTSCYYGGVRWWFRCPLVINGKQCNRKVGVLYLGNGKYFGCRHCYNLIYESSKTHDKRLDYLLKNPGMFYSYLSSNKPSKQLLAMKADI
ncbi:MAG: hypothetical protein GY817_00705 [bacterium]|nr:hypothetical protein [bacterium]